MRKRFNWIERAREMRHYDVMYLGVISTQSVRQSLNRLKLDPAPEVSGKSFLIKRIPHPDDRKLLEQVKAGKVPASEAIYLYPERVVFVCCGEWPDLRNPPRVRGSMRHTGVSKPASVPTVSKQVSGYKVAQEFPDYDSQSQVPPDWE